MNRPPGLEKAEWRSCNTGNCVEITACEGQIWVRGSRDTAGAVLSFTRDEWTAFLEGVRNGLFDLERLAPDV